VRAFIGLGANVGEARAALGAAVATLGALPGARLDAVSTLYRTRPVGVVDQPDFLNAAVSLVVPAGPDPETGALALLIGLKSIERAFGRGEGVRWGPRPLDLDLILFGDHEIRVERPPAARSGDMTIPTSEAQWLFVPHRSARERLFVLAPLADVAPDLAPPGWDVTVAAARDEREREEGPGAVERIGEWDADAGEWR
jgi:2-amino-4-hydroxy-6-hydroxymethyldihydropteridine diphosphokinase